MPGSQPTIRAQPPLLVRIPIPVFPLRSPVPGIPIPVFPLRSPVRGIPVHRITVSPSPVHSRMRVCAFGAYTALSPQVFSEEESVQLTYLAGHLIGCALAR